MKCLWSVFLFIGMLSAVWSAAQSSIVDLEGKNRSDLLFRHISPKNSPSLDGISVTFQDKHGFFWLATHQGLVRWDGQTTRVFSHNEKDSLSLPSNFVVSISEDKKGNLWVATSAGLARYNEQTFCFEQQPPSAGAPRGYVQLLHVDEKNRLYLYEANGNCPHSLYDPESRSYHDWSHQMFEQIFVLPRRPASDTTYVVGMNVGGGIRVGFQTAAADTLLGVRKFFDGSDKGFPKATILWRICPDDDAEHVWLGSQLGLIRFNVLTHQYQLFAWFGRKPVQQVSQVRLAPNGMLMLTTNNDGLFLFDKKKAQFIRHFKHSDFAAHSLNADAVGILSILNKNVLVAGTSEGFDIAMLQKRPFQKLLSKEQALAQGVSNAVSQLIRWDDTHLLLSLRRNNRRQFLMYNTETDAIKMRHPDLRYLKDLPPEGFIFAPSSPDDRFFWFGNTRRLFCLDKKRHTRFDFTPRLPLDIHIETIAVGKDNELMIAAQQHLYTLAAPDGREGRLKPIDSFEKLHSNSTREICYDKRRNCFFVLAEYGSFIVKIEKKEFIYEVTQSKWVDLPFSSTQDISSDTILFSSAKGIFFFNKKNFSLSEIELPTDIKKKGTVLRVLPNLLLVCVPSGYYVFNEITRRVQLLMGSEEPGFQTTLPRVFAFSKAKDKLFLGGSDGILKIDIKGLKNNFRPQRHLVYVTEISTKADRQHYEIPFGDKTERVLPKEENTFTIRFSAITYEATPPVFEYKMNGYDTDWATSLAGEVRYANVPKGNYTFYVREKRRLASVVSLPLVVRAGWYETWWFRLLSVSVVVGVSLLLYIQHRRVRQARLMVRQRDADLREAKSLFAKQMAESEMNALKAQMNPHFIFNVLNSIKSYVLTNDTETASMYITKFSKLIRGVLDSSRLQKITLKKELEILELYIEMEKMRFEEKFSYSVEIEKNLDVTFFEVPPMLVQPHIENAIWHGLMHKQSDAKFIEQII